MPNFDCLTILTNNDEETEQYLLALTGASLILEQFNAGYEKTLTKKLISKVYSRDLPFSFKVSFYKNVFQVKFVKKIQVGENLEEDSKGKGWHKMITWQNYPEDIVIANNIKTFPMLNEIVTLTLGYEATAIPTRKKMLASFNRTVI